MADLTKRQASFLSEEDSDVYFSSFGRWNWHMPGIEDCIAWLSDADFLIEPSGETKPSDNEHVTWSAISKKLHAGLAAHKSQKKSRHEIDALKEQYKDRPVPGEIRSMDEAARRLWNDKLLSQAQIVRFDFEPVAPDLLGCYRPFHLEPERWGIYISIGELLRYAESLVKTFAGQVFVLGSIESLISCVLFEVFNHEFFHHIVESTATTLEMASASMGQPTPIYRDYVYRKHESALGEHCHKPLEEALANAYAYNSFSFISRVKLGYRCIQAHAYQQVLLKVFPAMSPGYKEACHYCGPRGESNYVVGGAQILAMLFGGIAVEPLPLVLMSRHVMPRGHTALMEKAAVPTYLVGSEEEIKLLLEYVPAPNETYTSLFWPGDTTEVDRKVQQLQRAWKARQKANAKRG